MTVRDEQRRRARRTAIVLGLAALALYAGFIWVSVSRAHG
jgi:cell division septal protein FtsQ